MTDQAPRRVALPRSPAKSQAEWEQLRRALLMIIKQFKESDPDGCYTVDVRVVQRERPAPN